MKNALFWVLVGVSVVILGLIGYGIYLSVAHSSSGFDIVTAMCTGFILVGSLVAWELLMKPGYYRRRREGSRGEEPEEPGPEGGSRPPSL